MKTKLEQKDLGSYRNRAHDPSDTGEVLYNWPIGSILYTIKEHPQCYCQCLSSENINVLLHVEVRRLSVI